MGADAGDRQDRSLAAVLERFADVVESLAGSGPPVDGHGVCVACSAQVAEPAEGFSAIGPLVGHDPATCGWRLAQSTCGADFVEVRRLAHVLRYDTGVASGRRGRPR